MPRSWIGPADDVAGSIAVTGWPMLTNSAQGCLGRNLSGALRVGAAAIGKPLAAELRTVLVLHQDGRSLSSQFGAGEP